MILLTKNKFALIYNNNSNIIIILVIFIFIITLLRRLSIRQSMREISFQSLQLFLHVFNKKKKSQYLKKQFSYAFEEHKKEKNCVDFYNDPGIFFSVIS